ncbi:MAG: DUF3786 domain-containing protein [Desulfobacterales bacterium]|nr:DUF3786 domain-containing protein [Desulfobacterales bacterium]
MNEKSTVFEETYSNYLARIAKLDFAEISGQLGAEMAGEELVIPFFGKPYRISKQGLSDVSSNRPDFSACVVLFKYLLLCPNHDSIEDDWVTFKDFKDAAPFAGAFINYTETPLADHFAGDLARLEAAARKLNGQPPDAEFPYDLSVQFPALPKVPLLMLFNDADEEFGARCAVLFERRAETYLDMECLAMLGMQLFERLKDAADSKV